LYSKLYELQFQTDEERDVTPAPAEL
jgi:hypothetical protein